MPEPERVRRTLLEDRRETIRRRYALAHDFAGVVAAASDVATDDEHDPEGATIAYERARTAALIELADVHLADIDQALRRLDEGSYPTCERCGQAIDEERLVARPVARTCIGCASSEG